MRQKIPAATRLVWRPRKRETEGMKLSQSEPIEEPPIPLQSDPIGCYLKLIFYFPTPVFGQDYVKKHTSV